MSPCDLGILVASLGASDFQEKAFSLCPTVQTWNQVNTDGLPSGGKVAFPVNNREEHR